MGVHACVMKHDMGVEYLKNVQKVHVILFRWPCYQLRCNLFVNNCTPHACHWSEKSQGNSRSGKSRGILCWVREVGKIPSKSGKKSLEFITRNDPVKQ